MYLQGYTPEQIMAALHKKMLREAKERAEERLRQHQSKMEYYRSTASLSRAMARLKEAKKFRW